MPGQQRFADRGDIEAMVWQWVPLRAAVGVEGLRLAPKGEHVHGDVTPLIGT